MTPDRAPALADPLTYPAETLRLLEEKKADLLAIGADPRWIGVEADRIRVRDGSMLGALYVGPKDEAVALATWETPSELGRRVTIYLSRHYRTAPLLGSFLDRLSSAAPGSPVLSVRDDFPALDGPAREKALVPRGFFPVVRLDLLYPHDRALFPEPAGPAPGVRSLRTSDAEAIALLMARAYQDNPTERGLFLSRRDVVEDARQGISEVLGGGVGEWRPSASFGVEEDGRLVAATLVNEFHGPLLTEVMVDPDARRRGLASRLIRASIGAVRAMGGPTPVRLVVTKRNERAYRLYRNLGFVPDGTEGRIWLNLKALEIPEPTAPTDG